MRWMVDLGKKHRIIFKSILISLLALLGFIFCKPVISQHFIHPKSRMVTFSIAQIPDTQSFFSHSYYPQTGYTSPPPYSHPMQIVDMYKWIIDQKYNGARNFLYIAHVGDIIEMGGACGTQTICTTDEQDPPIPDPSKYKHSETYVEWHAAESVFNLIEDDMNKKTFIPFGFAMGNHDPRSSDGSYYGHGILSSKTTVSVRAFLQNRYQHNPHQYVDMSQYGYKDSSLMAYYDLPEAQTGGVSIRILNLPYNFGVSGFTNDLVKFIQQNPHRLFILNTHKCDEAYPLLNQSNVLMLLCGHDPAHVDTKGNYDITTKIAVSDKPVYRFDYQADDIHNLPQQPLVRFYDFSFDPVAKKLYWQANDVRAWTAGEVLNQKGLDPDGFYDNAFFTYKIKNNGWDTANFPIISVPIGIKESIQL